MLIQRAWNGLIRLCRRIPFVDRHWELWVYIFFGGLTTVFSWAVYYLCSLLILPPLIPEVETEGLLAFLFAGKNLMQAIAKAVSWFLSVAFAFFTNRAFVFHDRSRGLAFWGKLGSFYASRVVSGVVFEIFGFILLNSIMPDFAALLITSVAVIVVNYIFSKLVIFRKQKTPAESRENA